jgi:hypothetical protein
VWVIPGNGRTCLIVNARAIPSDGTQLNDATATCIADYDAAAGKLVTSIQYNGDNPPHEFVAGLVPDGLKADTAMFAGPSGDVVVRP